jgi:hypothetical protein
LGLALPASAQQAPSIILPDILAVELPRGRTDISPTESPLRELLAAGRSGTRTVSTDLQRKVGAGPVRVSWNAWDGAPGAGKPRASRTARIFILPNGMTPVGVSGDENATGGNNGMHIVRDPTGRVHMIWQDGGREGGRTGAVYRRASIASDGNVKFETGPIYVADDGPSDWNAYPSLTLVGNSVQLVWQGGGTARTRRVSPGAGGWTLGPIINTGAKSEGRDVGAVIAADSKGGLHIVTPNGIYAVSTDEGRSWKTEAVPLPPGASVKTSSLAADLAGVVHIAFTAPIARPDPPGAKLGGYWQLRTVDRTSDGKWVKATDVLALMPGWAEPKGPDDLLADWSRIAADAQGGLHLTWHGTVFTHKFANDAAFYAYKKPGGAWQKPVLLVPQEAARGVKFSYAPSLTLDGDRALVLSFYDVYAEGKQLGFDSRLAFLRNGVPEQPSIPVSQFVSAAVAAKRPETAMGSRFPNAAPSIFRAADGRAMLDILELYQSPFEPGGANLVVYHRLDLTANLRRP